MSDDVREQIAETEKEIAEFQAQRDAAMAVLKKLMESEDPAAGVFHAAEIHEARQEKLRLEFEIQFRKGRLSRLRFS